MRVLILGGTLFLGRRLVESALARGWHVTTFNRGISAADVTGAHVVLGDRNVDGDLADALPSGHWDAVVDLGGYVPRNVLSIAELLEGRCDRYIFLSSVSAYEGWPAEPLTQFSPVFSCPVDAGPDFGPPDVEDGPTRYGRLKAGCEHAVRKVFGPHRSVVIRPGVILGPGEYVGRLPWWLWRVNAGGSVVAPGEPDRTIQPIDVRDVGDFVLNLTANGISGTFNATAPIGRATFADLLTACRDVTGSAAEFVWVADRTLMSLGIRQWSEIPLWRVHSGVWMVDSALAFEAGLTSRLLIETVRDTWDWMNGPGTHGPNERSAEIGLSAAREAEIMRAVKVM